MFQWRMADGTGASGAGIGKGLQQMRPLSLQFTPPQKFTMVSLGLIIAMVIATSLTQSSFYRRAIIGRESAVIRDMVTAVVREQEDEHMLFEEIGRHLQACGFQVAKGTIVDATIISAPASTKNKEKARDPEMCQTKKGNQWYFGMKAHIGADSQSKLMHSVAFTAANVHDSQP